MYSCMHYISQAVWQSHNTSVDVCFTQTGENGAFVGEHWINPHDAPASSGQRDDVCATESE